MSEFIQDSIRALLQQRRENQSPKPTRFSQQKPLDKAAEDPRDYKTGTED